MFSYIFYMETTLGELKSKEVINIIDGARLGRVGDLVFDLPSGRINGFIVPGRSSFLGLIKNTNNSIYIPFNQICKIGEDVILVELYITSAKVKTLKQSNTINLNERNMQNNTLNQQ